MNTDNSNYIMVYGYMMRDLKLSGYELLLYALIKSFTDNSEEKCFYGSQGYLAEWLGTKRESVNRSLKKLLEKGLIIKSSKIIGDKEYTSYMCQNDTPCVTKQHTSLLQNITSTCDKTSHNNNIYNNKDKNINNTIYNDLII